MRIKFFGHYFHLQLLLLWIFELLTTAAAASAALVYSVDSSLPYLLHRTSVFALCVSLAMAAMGLYSLRQRDRLIGIALRLLASVVAGAFATVATEGAFLIVRTPTHTIGLACLVSLAL